MKKCNINKKAGIANIEYEIIDVMIIFLLALLKNKYNKYEIGKKTSACLAYSAQALVKQKNITFDISFFLILFAKSFLISKKK